MILVFKVKPHIMPNYNGLSCMKHFSIEEVRKITSRLLKINRRAMWITEEDH